MMDLAIIVPIPVAVPGPSHGGGWLSLLGYPVGWLLGGLIVWAYVSESRGSRPEPDPSRGAALARRKLSEPIVVDSASWTGR